MQKRTKQLLGKLEEASWFEKVGAKCSDCVLGVSSWSDAMKKCKSTAWGDVGTETVNQIHARIQTASPQRYEKLSGILTEVRPLLGPLISRKVKPIVAAHKFSPILDGSIKSDLILICLETEFADICPPGFASNLLYWYLAGHFPCGIQGLAKKVDVSKEAYVNEFPNLYPPGFYDPIAKWYETGFGDWQGAIPGGKLIVY